MAEILRASWLGPTTRPGDHTTQVAKALLGEAGSLPPSRLSAAHIMEIDTRWKTQPLAASTRWNRSKALRQILRWLWEYHGAPKLDTQVRRYTTPRPRNVTVTDDERAMLITAAPEHVRLWLLLCADLAIRSGTALRIGPTHYDPTRRTLTFTTKCDEHLTLPTTAEIDTLIRKCSLTTDTSFVRQLWRAHNESNRFSGRLSTMNAQALRVVFRKLCEQVGLTRRVVLHDLRRTAAVAIYTHTGDIRDAQALLGHKHLASTFWYLDHDLRPVKRSTLELIKSPAWRKEHVA